MASTNTTRGVCPPGFNNKQCGSRTLGDINHTTPATAGKQNMLLRKEVIQPHLPVRLPCYDFVPIADPTFDSSLEQATGFGCYQLS